MFFSVHTSNPVSEWALLLTKQQLRQSHTKTDVQKLIRMNCHGRISLSRWLCKIALIMYKLLVFVHVFLLRIINAKYDLFRSVTVYLLVLWIQSYSNNAVQYGFLMKKKMFTNWANTNINMAAAKVVCQIALDDTGLIAWKIWRCFHIWQIVVKFGSDKRE